MVTVASSRNTSSSITKNWGSGDRPQRPGPQPPPPPQNLPALCAAPDLCSAGLRPHADACALCLGPRGGRTGRATPEGREWVRAAGGHCQHRRDQGGVRLPGAEAPPPTAHTPPGRLPHSAPWRHRPGPAPGIPGELSGGGGRGPPTFPAVSLLQEGGGQTGCSPDPGWDAREPHSLQGTPICFPSV